MVEKISIFTLLKGEKARNLWDFCVVDIRGRQSFLAAHLRNSYHLPSKDEILAFIKQQNNENLGLAKSRENQNLPQSRKNPNSPKNRKNQQNSPKPLLIVCFSSARARKMCEDLVADAEFAACYGCAKLHYLDCGIMEAFDNGFEICAGVADFANNNANSARNSSGGVNFVGETRNANLLQILDKNSRQSVNFVDSSPATQAQNDEMGQIPAQNSNLNSQIPQNSHPNPQIQHPANPLVAATIADIKEKYLSHKKAWVVTFSGGGLHLRAATRL